MLSYERRGYLTWFHPIAFLIFAYNLVTNRASQLSQSDQFLKIKIFYTSIVLVKILFWLQNPQIIIMRNKANPQILEAF